MSTFQAKIDDYIGTFSDTAALSDWLTTGATIVARLLPEDEALKYSVLDTIASGGTAITGKRVLFALSTTSNRAIKIRPEMEAKSIAAGSIHLATVGSAVWLIKIGKIYVHPSGGFAQTLTYPTVAFGDSTVATLPAYADGIIVLYAAIQATNSNIATKIATIGTQSYTPATPPSAPLAASFAYTDATGTVVAATTIDISALTDPTYTKPVIPLTAVPSDLSIVATAPATPIAPVLTYSAAALGTFSAVTVGALGTAPTYTKPTLTLTTAIPELVSGSSLPATPIAPVIAYTPASQGTFSNTVIGDLGVVPIYVAPTVPSGLDISDASAAYTAIITNEDIELGQTELGRQKMLLEEFSLDIQNNLNSFNQSVTLYQSTVQEAIENAKIAHDTLMKDASDTTNLSLQNEVQAMNVLIQDYQLTLGKYSSDLDAYAKEVQNNVGVYSQNLSKWSTTRQTELQEYGSNIQNELNEYNKELAVYMSTVQAAIKDADFAQQKMISSANATTQLNLQNEAQTLAALVQDYSATLGKYSGDLDSYGKTVNSEVSEFSINLQKWTAENQQAIAVYQSDIQNETNEWQNAVTIWQADVQEIILNAQMLQQKLLNDANRKDNIALANKAKNLEEQVSQYSALLGKYSTEVNAYSIEVQEGTAVFSKEIDQAMAESQALTVLLKGLKTEYAELMKIHLGV